MCQLRVPRYTIPSHPILSPTRREGITIMGFTHGVGNVCIEQPRTCSEHSEQNEAGMPIIASCIEKRFGRSLVCHGLIWRKRGIKRCIGLITCMLATYLGM